MANEWYIVQTYTGYEGKVSRVIQQKLDAGELSSDIVKSIKVPEEELVEIKDGKKKSRKNKILPGYIMAELDLPDLGWKETCNKIRHIQGVSGFVGTAPNERPRPISIGTVDALDDEKEKLTVTVQIFGRATPVELSMTQVEKAI